MTQKESDNYKGVNKGQRNKIIATFICTLFLACLAFSYGMFHSEPSLAYLVFFYVAFFMLILAIILIRLVSGKMKIWTALITMGTTVSLVISAMNNAPNEALMSVGQATTGISLLVSTALYLMIWKK